MLRVPSQISDQTFESLKFRENTFVAFRSSQYPFSNQVYFEENTIIYILEGDKIFRSEKAEYRVQKGDLLFVKKDYSLFSESTNEDYKSLVFFIDSMAIKEFVNQNTDILRIDNSQKSPYWVLRVSTGESFEKFIESVLSYFRVETRFLNQFLKLKAQELLLHLIDSDKNDNFKRFLLQNFSSDRIDLESVLNAFYLKNMTLDELAKISGRSLSTFKREFALKFGESPATYIRNKKLDYADFLLRNRLKNVEETARATGFESVSHFIQLFKSRFGVTPKQI